MNVTISKSEISGIVQAPPSKSYTIRGLMCAALARGKSEIINPLGSDDTDSAIRVLRQTGVKITEQENRLIVHGGHFKQPVADLYCGESAATLRFMAAICSLINGKSILTVGPSLARRPVKPLIDALNHLGVNCYAHGECPPVVVEGGTIKSGITELPGNISSQFVSALLLIAPRVKDGITVKITTPLESKAYVMMTMDTMQWFGITVAFSEELDEFEVLRQNYKPVKYRVEGDWSSASYLLAMGAVAGDMEVQNLTMESLQSDRVIVKFLQDMGASVNITDTSISVSKAVLTAIKADLTESIDLLPTMAVLASLANGTSEFTGIERARLKESNRVMAIAEGLERMGIEIKVEENRMTITGSKPTGATIESKNDHRIAMAFSLIGLVTGNTTINNAECVSKTYPEFWDILKTIGGEVNFND